MTSLWQDVCRQVESQQTKKSFRHNQRVKLLDFTFSDLIRFPIVFAGSRADGTNSSSSDTDLIFVIQNFIVTDKESTSSRQHMFKLVENKCHAGYCNLALKNISELTKNSSYCDKKGFLSNSKFINLAKASVPGFFENYGGKLKDPGNIHGPCVAPRHTFGKEFRDVYIDLAFCVPCDHWPQVATEWYRRTRKNQWPSQETVEKIHNTHCTFVPIGYSNDIHKRDLEWRISFTAAEKILTTSLNGTQILCLDALKLLHSSEIEKRFPNLICSYFLKSIMFWVVEDTPVSIWTPENFSECFHISIQRLVQNMKSGKCPHYFIRENNMFDGKDNGDLKECVLFIESLEIDSLICKYLQMKNIFFKRNVIFQHHIFIAALSLSRHIIHAHAQGQDGKDIESIFASHIESLEHSGIDENLIRQLQGTLLSTTGSIKFANLVKQRTLAERCSKSSAIDMLTRGSLCDLFAGNLKLATAVWYQGNITDTLKTLQVLQLKDPTRFVHYSFYDRHYVEEPTDDSYTTTDTSLQQVMADYIALDVIFLPIEIGVVPNFIKYLLIDGRTVFISPIVYMYCLEFTCYMKTGDMLSMSKALEKFTRTRRNVQGGLPHIDTDIRGYFYLMLGDYKSSFRALSASAKTHKSGSSSLWLLATLFYEIFHKNINSRD